MVDIFNALKEKKKKRSGTKRWLGGYEHVLLLQKNKFGFQHLMVIH